MTTLTHHLTAAALLFGASWGAHAQVLNLYTARHYQTDEALYADFTKTTGVRINRIEADDAGILARLKAEGSASPADVILLVDAARLWAADRYGLFQPVKSAVLEQRSTARSNKPAYPMASRSSARSWKATRRVRCSIAAWTRRYSWSAAGGTAASWAPSPDRSQTLAPTMPRFPS